MFLAQEGFCGNNVSYFLYSQTLTCDEYLVAVVQSLSRVQLFATPWTAARQASLSFTISQSLLKLRSIESVMLSNYLMLCQLFSFCLSSFPANTGGAANPHGELTYPRSKLLKCKAANPEPTLLTSCSMRLHSGSPSPAPMDPGPHD